MEKIIILGFCYTLITLSIQAQYNRPDIVVKKINIDLSPAPRYSVQGQSLPAQVPPNDSNKRWLIVEAELECAVQWADEVTLRFYVVANYGPTAKSAPPDKFDILATSVTVVNLQRNVGTGKRNIIPVFMDANTVQKYGAMGVKQFIPQVAVQVYYKGALQDTFWMSNVQKGVRFWETKSPRIGILLNLFQSHSSNAFSDFYAQDKRSGAGATAF